VTGRARIRSNDNASAWSRTYERALEASEFALDGRVATIEGRHWSVLRSSALLRLLIKELNVDYRLEQ
jgi:hypothetical protein